MRNIMSKLLAPVLALSVVSSVPQPAAAHSRGDGAVAFGIAAAVIGGIALSRSHRHHRYYNNYYDNGYDYDYAPSYRRSYYRGYTPYYSSGFAIGRGGGGGNYGGHHGHHGHHR